MGVIWWQNSKCRLYECKNETVIHKISECRALTQNKCMFRHKWVGKVIYKELWKRLKFHCMEHIIGTSQDPSLKMNFFCFSSLNLPASYRWPFKMCEVFLSHLIIIWTREEHMQMNQRMQKLLMMKMALRLKDDIDFMYHEKKEEDSLALSISVEVWFGLVSLFNGISTYVG